MVKFMQKKKKSSRPETLEHSHMESAARKKHPHGDSTVCETWEGFWLGALAHPVCTVPRLQES